VNARFELGVWNDDAPVPLSRCSPEQIDGAAALFIELDGTEYVGDAWSLGDLRRVAQQVDAAAARLEAGDRALIRSAEDDGDSVPYLRFTPRGNRVELLLFFIPPSEGDVGALYPIPYSGDPARLYSWVEAAGDVVARVPAELRELVKGPIELPREELIAQMHATVSRARDLGIDVPETPRPQRVRQVVPLSTGNRRADRAMIEIPRRTVRIGLTVDEADRLAVELARMAERLQAQEQSLKGFAPFDLQTEIAERRAWLEAARPAHDVEVGPFSIDVYPVTVAQWRQYMRDAGATEPQRAAATDTAFVSGISWNDAQAYAHYYQLDLPSETEWECAARRDRRFFTWGDAYFPQGKDAFAEPTHQAYIVGSRPQLASPAGVHDLLGQFGEFCADRFAPYPGANLALFREHFPDSRTQRVVRGGYDVYQDATCVARRGVAPDERRLTIKFRCVRR
jgi:formylglycine-generating enzyme required for sulfatase activity